MAVSLYHQGGNIDRARLRQLTGEPEPARPPRPRKPVRDWLLDWIDDAADLREQLDSLPGVLWHLADAWARRAEPNVRLVHSGQLRRGPRTAHPGRNSPLPRPGGRPGRAA